MNDTTSVTQSRYRLHPRIDSRDVKCNTYMSGWGLAYRKDLRCLAEEMKISYWLLYVRPAGHEPTRLLTIDFESGASANSATSANG